MWRDVLLQWFLLCLKKTAKIALLLQNNSFLPWGEAVSFQEVLPFSLATLYKPVFGALDLRVFGVCPKSGRVGRSGFDAQA